ncbi:MAG: S46 family peptidase [Pirellulaceae bacterium]|nr:S46 family peptidase [Pirellulaceae bacterium]
MKMKFATRVACLLVVGHVLSSAGRTNADEGMWLFNDLPRDYLKRTYDFEATPQWAEHLMRASVRFNSGGSASFVSSRGLVLTNHHVGADTISKLSTSERNYYRDGFYAATLDEELAAPDLELNQLVSIEDVTDRVNQAVRADMPASEALAARRAAMAQIEAASLAETGLRSDVVTLYGGAKYHLYRYKKYTDVRLVWAPESDIAFFGGDADNFEYPRYCLDVCLFRVYEDGKPAQIADFLSIAPGPLVDEELVFVSGNPGRTRRIHTSAALKFQRDERMPHVLNLLRRREILFQQYGLEGDEKQRQAQDDLFGIQNSRKAYLGMLQGLQDPAVMAQKEAAEQTLLAKVAADASGGADAWKKIAEVQERRKPMLKQSGGFYSGLYSIAETLVLMAKEDQKPSADRLREYRDSNRESLLQQLFSPAPLYPDLEEAKLADSLSMFVEQRGGDDPLVQQVLAGKSPAARAAELMAGTKLAEIPQRKRLAEGGLAAIEQSEDPLVRLALLMENEQRRLREQEEELAEIERQAYARIADVLFAVQGTSTYPDATFTLRLAFGPVRGYEERGRQIAAWTTLGGAFERDEAAGSKSPWRLPDSWRENRDRLDLATQFNFVCTADIIGGNSGSPVVNRAGELVGVIFDGNIQSLSADFVYSETQSRAVSVHVAAMREALKKVYHAQRLVDELGQ